ncbi:hypothetical protein KCT17_003681 [Escherichia coli]|nr:hypothetical protein [Escherichia coli]
MSNVAYADFRGRSRENKSVDNKQSGYFSVFRSLFQAEWAREAIRCSLWMRLLSLARYKPGTVEFKGQKWQLETGQLITSAAILAEDVKVDGKAKPKKTIDRHLDFFVGEGMITKQANHKGVIITISNFAEYQNLMNNEVVNISPVSPSVSPEPSAGAALEGVRVSPNVSLESVSPNVSLNVSPEPSAGAGCEGVDVSPDVSPNVSQNNKVFKRSKTPLNPPADAEGEKLAGECLDYFNQATSRTMRDSAPFLKALGYTRQKGPRYSVEDIQLVTDWAVATWSFDPTPVQLCRMTRFDEKLAKATQWRDAGGDGGRNPTPCPHTELVSIWNRLFPAKPVVLSEWVQGRPAYRNLEIIWNRKTPKGAWREVKHIEMAFQMMLESSQMADYADKPWKTLDWLVKPDNWGSVYGVAYAERKARRGVTQ